MEPHDYSQQYKHQAAATTIVFFALTLFGLVFWKLFGADGARIAEVQAASVAELQAGPAVSWNQ